MSTTVMINCDAGNRDGTCGARVYVTAQEIATVMAHPDASPRNSDLDTARHIAASEGWSTFHRWDIGRSEDRCPAHSGVTPRRRRLTP